MTYSASEAARKLKLTKETLRYYERDGLLPPISKNKSGHRAYSETDMEWIFLIKCLRDTDMPIAKIKQYVSLLVDKGGESIPERREILLEHKIVLAGKITLFQNLLQLIGQKIAFYDKTLSLKDQNAVRCIDYITEWEQFRKILGGI